MLKEGCNLGVFSFGATHLEVKKTARFLSVGNRKSPIRHI
jgi:hypothetical protein